MALCACGVQHVGFAQLSVHPQSSNAAPGAIHQHQLHDVCGYVLAVCRASVPFALLNASVAASQVVAAPLAAALLRLDGVAGLAGWQ